MIMDRIRSIFNVKELENNVVSKGNNRLLIGLYFFFKTMPAFVSAMAIYLGYRLFVFGVTGEASLSIESEKLGGQLINAAPGLFFAIGGLVSLIISVWRGVNVQTEGATLATIARENSNLELFDLLVLWICELMPSWFYYRRGHLPIKDKDSPTIDMLKRLGVEIIDPKGKIIDEELEKMIDIEDITYNKNISQGKVLDTLRPIIKYKGKIIPAIVYIEAPKHSEK